MAEREDGSALECKWPGESANVAGMKTERTGNAIVPAPAPDRGLLLMTNAIDQIEANSIREVLPAIKAAESAAAAGMYVAGFLSYEAAPAMDASFRTRPGGRLPLAWFGIYRDCGEFRPRENGLRENNFDMTAWRGSISEDRYDAAIAAIRRYLEAGDTYQVNFSIRLKARFDGNAHDLFMAMLCAQGPGYQAYFETNEFAICSASPELFFRLDSEQLTARPMKGTSERGLTWENDCRMAAKLAESEKNRAENVMIVDMIRNDMGRIAEQGTVEANSLFNVERYPTLLQMTSNVNCRTTASVTDIMQAMFPCASVTGAPKVRTMEIISELEDSPRGVYTGCAGSILPNRKACFNVAIRTVSVDKRSGEAEYGVGGGVVWDSESSAEYSECMLKAQVLLRRVPDFSLLESLLWEPGSGYFLLDEHLERMRRSARYFGYQFDKQAALNALRKAERTEVAQKQKVRLTSDSQGSLTVEIAELVEDELKPVRMGLATEPVDCGNVFLYHKTTNRTLYDQMRKSRADCDDVLLWNSNGEVTESAIANVVFDFDGRLCTPPVECGLLPGVFRNRLVERGEVREQIVQLNEISKAVNIYLVNSVRKWRKAELVSDGKRK